MPRSLLVIIWLIAISETAVFLIGPRLKRMADQSPPLREGKVLLSIGAVFALWPFSLAFRKPDIVESFRYWQEQWRAVNGQWWKGPLLILCAPILVALSIEHASCEVSAAVAVGALINFGLLILAFKVTHAYL